MPIPAAAPPRPADAKPPEAAPRRAGMSVALLRLAAARAGEIAARRARRAAQIALGGFVRRLPSMQRLHSSNIIPPRQPDTPYDILCLPIIEWDYRFQRPQQLMREFSRRGHRVFYASHDFLLFARAAIRRIEENVWDVRFRGNTGLDFYRAAASPRDSRQMADALAALPLASEKKETLLVVEHPFWTALAEELRRRHGWPIVYDCMDDLAGFSRRRNAAVEIEPRLMEAADLVVASSDVLFDKAKSAARRATLVRNGVDYEHFSGVGQPPRASEPTIGYYGAISRWFDAALVAELAALRPRWRFKLIGRTLGADLHALRKQPNVELLGERPYAELPAHLADWHCCIIPFKQMPLTAATNPVKVYEMLAAGRPVASVELPELRPLAEAGLIAIAHDAQGFAAEIERMLSADSPEEIARRRAFAMDNTWSRRCDQFAAAVAAIM